MENNELDKATKFLEELLNGQNPDLVFHAISEIRENNKNCSPNAALIV